MSVQVIGNYDLVEKIAEGGMGTVYKGRNRLTNEWAAIKVIPKHIASNPIHLKRFEQEYSAAKVLDHPNIVKALEFGRWEDLPYLVMEYVEGETLGQRLEREYRIPEDEAIRIISDVAHGLHQAHKQGLVHRDVKPDNVLLTPEGHVKLTDLGLVKEIDTDLNLTRTGRGLGTPHFMAPEQFRNAKRADARCDIYSLAASLYMMVTGELPFKACGPLDAWMKKINNDIPTPKQLVATISERVDWAIRRSMSADPSQRASNCREFIEDLTGQSTRPLPRFAVPDTDPKLDIWYLLYRDDREVVHTVKGTIDSIRQSLTEGLLGDASNIRVSRCQGGPFDPLRDHPEFRDLVVEPAPMPLPNGAANRRVEPARVSSPHHATPPQVSTVRTTPLNVEMTALRNPERPRPVSNSTFVPQISLPDRRRTSEMWQWALLALVALITGLASFYFKKYW